MNSYGGRSGRGRASAGGGGSNGNGNGNAAAAALETINDAATTIASRASPASPPAHAQKKRWRVLWKLYWCFGFRKHQRRIGHAILSPETANSVTDAPADLNFVQPLAMSLPFVAPPSSPASFIPSELPSAAQSPTGLLSFTSISANMYSPPGPHSMFAIGPYAHETQIVSPPVFSTFTTEPSTAPVTPPSESINMTTPASPEVPFAQFLDPNLQSPEASQRFPLYQYEFQPYQLSPGSGISGSGTSSPFPGGEIAASLTLLKFRANKTSSIFDIDVLRTRDWDSSHNSGSLTPGSMGPSPRIGTFHTLTKCENNGNSTDGAVALFDLPPDDVNVGESNPAALAELESAPSPNSADVKNSHQRGDTINNVECSAEGSSTSSEMDKIPNDLAEKRRHQRRRSITLGSSRDFTFEENNGKDAPRPLGITSGWSGETVVEEEQLSTMNWSFPVIQAHTS